LIKKTSTKLEYLFPIGEAKPRDPEVARIKNPIWTENKAKLIACYLRYFVFITKNGAYIDGFAGPQEETDSASLWSARLVMQNEPRWIRQFHLFDACSEQVKRLQTLRDGERPLRPKNHRIQIVHGDFNQKVGDLLRSRPIRDAEATFCLLDQRTFECHWATVEQLAAYKPRGRPKIEQFYFFPSGWLGRALSALKNEAVLRSWWGGGDLAAVRAAKPFERLEMLCKRFTADLGYASAKPWPIWDREEPGGRVMYHMIHATDHPEAPKLMARAYKKAVDPREPIEQLTLDALLAAP
jgi:three-Cys-motif partner protein